jgi:hypothetical protein
MEIDQVAKRFQIQRTIRVHRGNNGNNRTGDHQGTILENGKTKTLNR